jgi:hypothetical protein
VVDFDLDGRNDLIITSAEGDALYSAWYRAPANPRTGGWRRTVYERGLSNHQVLIGDVDLDGDQDIVGGESWSEGGVFWWENVDGFGRDLTRRVVVDDLGCYNCVISDFDKDGDLDVAGPSHFHGPVYLYENLSIR